MWCSLDGAGVAHVHQPYFCDVVDNSDSWEFLPSGNAHDRTALPTIEAMQLDGVYRVSVIRSMHGRPFCDLFARLFSSFKCSIIYS